MRKVILYSVLLVAGLIISQFLPQSEVVQWPIRILTMIALSFIMIHVGYEFEIDRNHPRQYVWDYVVAGTAAAFPWIFCALYFVFVVAPPELRSHPDLWREALLESRFASPTSAGVLFAMLAAAGLAATWVFQKARILAIFDDLDTILLMVPLKVMMVGMKWSLVVVVTSIVFMLGLAWRYLHRIRLPITWPFVLGYSALIVGSSELIYLLTAIVDKTAAVHLEVLLPAFVLGCVMARPPNADPHIDDAIVGSEEGPETRPEQKVSAIVSACFMVLVGASMPSAFGTAPDMNTSADLVVSEPVRALAYEGVSAEVMTRKNASPGAWIIALHVLAITLLSNLGKMFPFFCYRREASLRERLALSIAMFPRGEVGAGVLVISLGYGLGGTPLTIAVLSLALNLLCTGFFILAVKRLLLSSGEALAEITRNGQLETR